jgi:hypothetical protein
MSERNTVMKLKNVFAAMVSVIALGAAHVFASDLKPGEWYVRLILQTDSTASNTENLEDSYNLLGQLKNTAIGYDNRDLPEMGQTWAGTYLSVIFYRPQWGIDKQAFNTDFHPIVPNTADEWTFEVRSDDPARDLTLGWQGNQTNFTNMVLVDVEENVAVPAEINGVKQDYRFRMNGVVRQFSWRLLTKKEYKAFLASGTLPPSPLSVAQPAASLLAADQTTTSTSTTAKSAPRNARPSSGWLPLGWSQGEGKGIPDDLPADPFGD